MATALVALAVAGGYFAATWPGFSPKHVRVTGNRIVATSRILAEARVDRHRNMWLQNAGAMAQRIESIPYVLSAQVSRRPPASIAIAVTERVPFAVVRSGVVTALVDPHMRVLETDPAQSDTFPTIVLAPAIALEPGRFLTQPAAVTARAVLVALRANGMREEEVEDDAGDVTAQLPGGVRVLLGDRANAAQAVPLIQPILTRFALLGRSVQILDLRSSSTPVVTARGSGRVATGSKRGRASPAPRRSP